MKGCAKSWSMPTSLRDPGHDDGWAGAGVSSGGLGSCSIVARAAGERGARRAPGCVCLLPGGPRRDESLSEWWDTVVSEAAVFAEREWVSLSESKDVYFDNLEDRRFFPSQGSLRVATGGHLGNSPSDRLRTAEALRLPLLSSSVSLEWHEDGASPPTAGWNPRLDLICKLLGRVRGDERAESDNAGVEIRTTLRVCRRLSLEVSVEGAAPEQVPVNARLHRSVLTVAGRPVQFGADAAKELLRSFSFGQRGDLAADLTGMLVAIDNASDFSLAADKFRRSFTPDFELPAEFRNETMETEGRR